MCWRDFVERNWALGAVSAIELAVLCALAAIVLHLLWQNREALGAGLEELTRDQPGTRWPLMRRWMNLACRRSVLLRYVLLTSKRAAPPMCRWLALLLLGQVTPLPSRAHPPPPRVGAA
eukprot:1196194-Prorocentrum_minimum.AAC.16